MIVYLPGRDSALNINHVVDADFVRDGNSFVCFMLLVTGDERVYRGEDARLLRRVLKYRSWRPPHPS
jgi:hypothetical protein